LIVEGRFELINGGLVQNDEATPRAKDILMNFEEGMRFCIKEFGIRP